MNDWKKYLLSSASVWYSAIHDVRADPPLNVAGCGSIVEILKSESSYTLNWKFNPLHSAFPVTVNVALPPSKSSLLGFCIVGQLSSESIIPSLALTKKILMEIVWATCVMIIQMTH